jgi:GNAT superfamily N-acetyltransferase
MILSKEDINSAVRKQLATDLNCNVNDFSREGFVFCEAHDNPGRRLFPRGECHFEMVTMGSAVIVSATSDILPYLRGQLDGRSRDEAFNMPFVNGTAHYFIPDSSRLITVPDGFDIRIVEREGIKPLYQLSGFSGAIHDEYDANHPRPDVLAAIAMSDSKVVGISGASADCEMLWLIGIAVLPEYRRLGLAVALTNQLTIAIMERGKVPYYGTSSSNIASQRTAFRAGFKPAWVCCYRGRFDGVLTDPTG